MLDAFVANAPIIGLVFFFGFFCCLLAWMLRPGMKQILQQHAYIPLEEEAHDKR